jgi:hypothetical protein
MNVRRSVLSLVVLTIVAVLVAPASYAVLGAGDVERDLARVLADPTAREDAITKDVHFRTRFHFEADRGHVEWLYEHPEATVGTRVAGALLTPDEWDEFVARDRLGSDASLIERWYEQHPGSRDDFAGVIIDHRTGGQVAVYVKPGAPTPWASDLGHPGRLDIRTADVSEARLQAIQATVDEAWEAGDAATTGVTATMIDYRHNAVAVGFEPAMLESLEDGELPAAFAHRFGRANLWAIPNTRAVGATTWIKAGWSYGLDSYAKWCSFGFFVDREGSSWDVMLSAGHCVDEGLWEDVWRGGNTVGPFTEKLWQDWADADVSLIRIEDDPYQAAKRVVHQGYILDVKAVATDYTVGNARCITGYAGDTVCGDIEANDVTGEYTTASTFSTWCGLAPSQLTETAAGLCTGTTLIRMW